MERPTPRTLLEQLVQDGDRTLDELCEAFDQCARAHGERGATLSVRQLSRWIAGTVDNARPASRRVAQHLWGYGFNKLVGRPDAVIKPDQQRAITPEPLVPQPATHQQDGAAALPRQEEISMAAEESARFNRRSAVSITPQIIEQLEGDIRRLAEEYMRQPPYAVFRPLAMLRHDVFEMIERHPHPAQLVGLYRVAAYSSAMLAHASSDLGQAHAADSHARTAWLCADLAEDDVIRPYVRWVQSNVAYWRTQYRDAAELANSGQQYTSTSSDQSRLSSQTARALAAMKDESGANRALASAAEAHTEQAHDHPYGVLHFAPGKAAYYASEVRQSLGGRANLEQAVRDAELALTMFHEAPEGETSAELVAAAQLDLVSAHVALTDLDAANAHMRTVLELPSENRTVPVVSRVTKIGGALSSPAFAKAALASELRDRIRLFKAYPAERELPSLSN
jgi:hypothetical protein